jgi:predicted ATPase
MVVNTQPGRLERDAQLQILHDRVEAVMAGHGRLALVSGEAGVGKRRWSSVSPAPFR